MKLNLFNVAEWFPWRNSEYRKISHFHVIQFLYHYAWFNNGFVQTPRHQRLNKKAYEIAVGNILNDSGKIGNISLSNKIFLS